MLKGENLRLRPVRDADIYCWVKWYNDPDVVITLGSGRMYGTTFENECEFYNYARTTHDMKLFTVESLKNEPVGRIGLRNINGERSQAELMVLIGEKQLWGKGYASEAIRLLLEFAFARMNLNRIWLKVINYNSAGTRCYEKAGFTTEATMREQAYVDGKYYNLTIMGILKKDWLAETKQRQST